MSIFEIILIGISLSIDAFSLAISIGLYIKKENTINYSLITGIYHLLMPIIGFSSRMIINKYFLINERTLFNTIILVIIINILFEKEEKPLKLINPLIFGFAVSIDSLLIGVSLRKDIVIISSSIFAFISCFFTYIGFKFANIIRNNFKKYSKFISISILIIILIKNLF